MTETRAELPIEGMKAMLRQFKQQEEPIRRGALALAAEGINSEAQSEAPIKTGVLKESHVVVKANPDAPEIGANTTYAAAVHANHPQKARWYLNAFTQHGARIMGNALKLVIDKLGKTGTAKGAEGDAR